MYENVRFDYTFLHRIYDISKNECDKILLHQFFSGAGPIPALFWSKYTYVDRDMVALNQATNIPYKTFLLMSFLS